MATMQSTPATPTHSIKGRIVESEVKISVDAARPLPLACALYAIETPEGTWLCAFYGANRSVFDWLPQKGAEVEESKLGITFHTKRLVPKGQYQPAVWADFKKTYFMQYAGHAE